MYGVTALSQSEQTYLICRCANALKYLCVLVVLLEVVEMNIEELLAILVSSVLFFRTLESECDKSRQVG